MPARRVLVLGASGGTGRHVLEQALAKGIEVTALVRTPENLASVPRDVRVIAGDILVDSPMTRGAFAGQDAVISTLGVGQSFKSGDLLARAAPLIVSAMVEHGIRRLVWTSAFGVGATWRDMPTVPRIFAKTLLRNLYADKAAGEQIIMRSALDWTVVYPCGLTNGARTGQVRISERLRLSGFPRISRADVASVLLQQVDDSTFVRKGVLLAAE
jgi:putative NADH-flavin reductase